MLIVDNTMSGSRRSSATDSLSSCSSSDSYDSVANLNSSNPDNLNLCLSDHTKITCLDALHCSCRNKSRPGAENVVLQRKGCSPQAANAGVAGELSKSSKNAANDKAEFTYKTRPSHWTRNNRVAKSAYTLLKTKRWYLKDENYIFDPLKKCNNFVDLRPANTLWRISYGYGDDQCRDPAMSVDAILNLYPKRCIKQLKKLDVLLSPLDEHGPQVGKYGLTKARHLQNELRRDMSIAQGFKKEYENLIYSLTKVLLSSRENAKLPELSFKCVFMDLIACVTACIGGASEEEIRCKRDVDTTVLENLTMPVEMGDGPDGRRQKLEICPEPDLYLFKITSKDFSVPRTVLAVVEVKGLCKGQTLGPDDEDNDEEDRQQCSLDVNNKRKPECVAKPHARIGGEDNDEPDDETSLENLLRHNPPWLDSLTAWSPNQLKGLKKFLPQLIGDMLCTSRSKVIRPLKSHSGLMFGIGVVGLEVYFVTMFDPCLRDSEFVVNNDTTYTSVFTTRPLKLLVKKDRRIILKTLAAAFCLDDILTDNDPMLLE